MKLVVYGAPWVELNRLIVLHLQRICQTQIVLTFNPLREHIYSNCDNHKKAGITYDVKKIKVTSYISALIIVRFSSHTLDTWLTSVQFEISSSMIRNRLSFGPVPNPVL